MWLSDNVEYYTITLKRLSDLVDEGQRARAVLRKIENTQTTASLNLVHTTQLIAYKLFKREMREAFCTAFIPRNLLDLTATTFKVYEMRN